MTGDRRPPQDPRVEAFLASLAEIRVPLDLAGSVIDGVRARPSRGPSLRLPLLAAAAGLLIVVGGAMAAGWQPPFDLVPGPAGGSAGAARPSATPETFEFLRVAAAGAPIRTEPGGAGSAIRDVTEGDLGLQVLVRERRLVDGTPWIKVEWQGFGEEASFVWLPETIDSRAPTGYTVTVFEPTSWLPCAGGGEMNAFVVLGSSAAERLACYGGASFSIGPVMVAPAPEPGGATGPTDGTPAWLVGPTGRVVVAAQEGPGSGPSVPLRIDPRVVLQVPAATWIRFTGHLDAEAAAGCTRESRGTDVVAGDAADQELWCRQQLVFTGLTTTEAPTAPPTPFAEASPPASP